MNEEWRTVSAAPDYEVSDMGHVRRRVSCRNSKAGKIIKPFADPGDGHVWVVLRINKKSKHFFLHTLMLTEFVGPRPSPIHQGAHNDGKP